MSIGQNGATIQKPILPGRVEPLRALLQSIGDDIKKNPHIRFDLLPSAHFLCWFIVDRPGTPPSLILELNVDGPIADFLGDLLAVAAHAIDLIYAHCEGYPGGAQVDPRAPIAYLLDGDVSYDCYYIGWRGLTVGRIVRERELRAKIETFLDSLGEPALATTPPEALRALIRAHVDADPTLAWARDVPPRPFLVRNRAKVVAAIKAVAAIVAIGLVAAAVMAWGRYGPRPVVVAAAIPAAMVGAILAVLRWKETTDKVSDAQPDHMRISMVTTRENQIVQNHFASIAAMKRGWFRWIVVKLVLKFVHVFAAVQANRGELSGITSIHFARWVVIDRGKNLLFLSNYDGSWENYLDDFIDRASPGLTAIWSNTWGFPRASWLVNGGARDEILFKVLVRQSQTSSLVWYSAYPDLSTQNIRDNAAIREGLYADLDGPAVLDWLKNF